MIVRDDGEGQTDQRAAEHHANEFTGRLLKLLGVIGRPFTMQARVDKHGVTT